MNDPTLNIPGWMCVPLVILLAILASYLLKRKG